MEHSEAIKMSAVERYVLGDLSVSEIEEFERHFFDCPQCSEELRVMTLLQDNARAVFMEQGSRPIGASLPIREPDRRARRAGWWPDFRIWVPALAMLAIAIFLGYQAGERRVGGPLPVSEFPLYAAARGEETVVGPTAGAQFYTLYMDRTWEKDFPEYRAAFVDAAPKERFSMRLGSPAAGQAIHILTPKQALPPGRYVLIVYGVDSGQETEVARYPFTLRFE